jgi:hypothetical protein
MGWQRGAPRLPRGFEDAEAAEATDNGKQGVAGTKQEIPIHHRGAETQRNEKNGLAARGMAPRLPRGFEDTEAAEATENVQACRKTSSSCGQRP